MEGCDVNARDNFGRTPLIWMCTVLAETVSEKAKKIIARLLECPGIDVLAMDDDGATARDWCYNDGDVKNMLREAEERQRKAEE